MRSLLPYLIVGVTSGSVYALLGLGLTLTFKTSGIVNFAHGAQAALAAFVMFELRQRVGLPWPLAALASLLLAGIIGGLLLERLGTALASASPAARIAATVGVLVGVQGVLTAVFGSATLQLNFWLPTAVVRVGGVNIRVDQIITAALAAAVMGGLYVFFRRSRTGLAIAAVVEDPDLAALHRIPPERVRRLAWMLGSSLAAISGMLIAPTLGLDPAVLTQLVLFAFGAAAVGGFTRLGATYAGGIGIGVGAALLTRYLHTTGPLSALPSSLPIIVLFVALLFLPRTSPTPSRLLAPLRWDRPTTAGAVVVGTAILLAVPAFAGSKLTIFATALAFVVLFGSLGLLVRGAGQVSLCHIAFAAVGATTFARALGAGLPWGLALLAGGLTAGAVGVVVALPSIRLSGAYLAVSTIAFGMLLQELVYRSFLLFGGPATILVARRPAGAEGDTAFYYVVLAVAAACVVVLVAIRRARLGRLLDALADEPIALDASGTNPLVVRLIVFALSALLAGIAGGLIGAVTGTVTPTSFDFSISLVLVAVLFVAGRQPLLGPVLAAALYLVGPAYLTGKSPPEWVPVVFGAAAVIATTAGGGRSLLERVASSERHLARVTAPLTASTAAPAR